MNKINHQKGTVLVLSLVILTVMTLISVTSLRTSVVDERMSGNLRDSEIALQAAESASREAYVLIDNITAVSFLDFDGTNGLFSETTPEPDFFNPATWTDDNLSTVSPTLGADLGNQSLTAVPPRRVIRFIGNREICGQCFSPGDIACQNPCNPRAFRVTAFGVGISPNTTRTIQSYYQIPR